MACLFSLPGILRASTTAPNKDCMVRVSDPAVREALWGGPGFSQNSDLLPAHRKNRSDPPRKSGLRYGRFYFGPFQVMANTSASPRF